MAEGKNELLGPPFLLFLVKCCGFFSERELPGIRFAFLSYDSTLSNMQHAHTILT